MKFPHFFPINDFKQSISTVTCLQCTQFYRPISFFHLSVKQQKNIVRQQQHTLTTTTATATTTYAIYAFAVWMWCKITLSLVTHTHKHTHVLMAQNDSERLKRGRELVSHMWKIESVCVWVWREWVECCCLILSLFLNYLSHSLFHPESKNWYQNGDKFCK